MINYYNANGYLLEGDQAEAYKAKKKAEKAAANKQRRADVNHAMGRAGALIGQVEKDKNGTYKSKSFQDKWDKMGSGHSGSETLDKAVKYGNDNFEDHSNIYNKKNADAIIKTTSAADAMMRHERRHPTKESTMMLAVNGIELF